MSDTQTVLTIIGSFFVLWQVILAALFIAAARAGAKSVKIGLGPAFIAMILFIIAVFV